MNKVTDEMLPALPGTDYNACGDGSSPLYTAKQVRDYARAALEAAMGADVGIPVSADERARFEAWCKQWRYSTERSTMGGKPIDHYVVRETRIAWMAWRAAADSALGQVIDQRDRYHEIADELASQIERITSVEVGEHSSDNCPWQNAIDAAESFNALAAREPVVLHPDPPGRPVYATAKNTASVRKGYEMGGYLKGYDRSQPVGQEPAGQEPYGWVITGPNGNMFCPASARHVMEANITPEAKSIGMTVEAVYSQSHEPKVDLGQFRAKVADLLRSEFDLEVADPEDHRHDDGSGEANRIAGRIVALIDSQGVGK